MKISTPTNREQRLLRLCRRLLAHNKQLHAEIKRLYDKLRWLGQEYLALSARFERAEQDRAVKEATADIFLGAALDELGRRSR
jgi:hypothetical protein